jgi:hypothetical protein
MRLVAVLFMLACSLQSGLAQSYDARLESKFSKSEIKQLQSDNPREFQLLNYSVAKGWYLGDYAQDKGVALDGEVEVADLENIDVYKLGFDFKDEHFQYVKIKGVNDKILVIMSRNIIADDMKKVKK